MSLSTAAWGFLGTATTASLGAVGLTASTWVKSRRTEAAGKRTEAHASAAADSAAAAADKAAQAAKNTVPVSNGFASGVTSQLAEIKGMVAAQSTTVASLAQTLTAHITSHPTGGERT